MAFDSANLSAADMNQISNLLSDTTLCQNWIERLDSSDQLTIQLPSRGGVGQPLSFTLISNDTQAAMKELLLSYFRDRRNRSYLQARDLLTQGPAEREQQKLF